MGQFVYYIPDIRPSQIAEALAQRGLGHVLAGGVNAQHATCQRFAPGNAGPGLLVAREAAACSAAGRTWRRVPLCDAWIGYDPENPPGPADLARGEMVGGYLAELEGAAGLWTIPLARVYPEGTRLPQALSMGSEGELIREPLPRYRAACRLADELWGHFAAANAAADDKPPAMTLEEEFAAAVQILAVNYRVSAAEASALGLLSTDNIQRIAMLFIDAPGYIAAMQAMAPKGGPEDDLEPDDDDEVKKKHEAPPAD